MFDVALQWERCPDGVEHVVGTPIETANGGLITRQYLQYRSDRRILRNFERIELSRAVVLQFINCRSTADQINFHSKYGFLRQPSESGREEIGFADILGEDTFSLNRSFSVFVERSLMAPAGERADIVNSKLFKHTKMTPTLDFLGPNQKPRIVFNVENLLQFIAAETAIAAISGLGFRRCANCENAFFIGPAAKTRSDAKTCSGACRSALMRKSKRLSASA